MPARPAAADKTPPEDTEAPVRDPEAPAADPAKLARQLRAQAEALEAGLPADEYVRMKVEPPQVSFSYGGVEIGPDWTPVHASLAPAVLRAAAGDAGVTITQEGG